KVTCSTRAWPPWRAPPQAVSAAALVRKVLRSIPPVILACGLAQHTGRGFDSLPEFLAIRFPGEGKFRSQVVAGLLLPAPPERLPRLPYRHGAAVPQQVDGVRMSLQFRLGRGLRRRPRRYPG